MTGRVRLKGAAMAGIGIMELAIVATAVLLLVGFLVRLR
mgnify:CR=1 FL=1